MNMYYGERPLKALKEVDVAILRNELYRLATNAIIPTIGGYDLHRVEEARHRTDSGYFLIGSDDLTEFIGIGYISDVGERIWITDQVLFIDGMGSVVEYLGFVYDLATRMVYAPQINANIANLEKV